MADYVVTANVRYRCQDERGRFYYQELQITGTVDGPTDNAGYAQALIDGGYVASSAPASCIGYGVTVLSAYPAVTQAEALTKETTIHYLVWCSCSGDETGPYTQTVNLPIGTDVGEIDALIKADAADFCQNRLPTSPKRGKVLYDEICELSRTEITAPLGYLYSQGD